MSLKFNHQENFYVYIHINKRWMVNGETMGEIKSRSGSENSLTIQVMKWQRKHVCTYLHIPNNSATENVFFCVGTIYMGMGNLSHILRSERISAKWQIDTVNSKHVCRCMYACIFPLYLHFIANVRCNVSYVGFSFRRLLVLESFLFFFVCVTFSVL